MRWVALLVPMSLLGAACSGGDDGPRPLERIDGPAQLDPDFVDGGGGSDGRPDSDG